MGALFSSPPKPPAIAPTPPMAAPSTLANPQVAQSAAASRSRAAAAAGGGSGGTVGASGPQGLSTAPTTAPATLLGSTSR